MQGRKLKAKYRTIPLGKIKVIRNKSWMDKETNSLQQQPKEVEVEMFMVHFPAGHSIRVDKKELVRLGFHLKPRLVDMETGDIVDMGGEEYNFEEEIVLSDDEPLTNSRKKAS